MDEAVHPDGMFLRLYCSVYINVQTSSHQFDYLVVLVSPKGKKCCITFGLRVVIWSGGRRVEAGGLILRLIMHNEYNIPIPAAFSL